MGAAEERIRQLFDEGTSRLMDDLTPTIHWLGEGRVDGRRVYACAGVPEAGRVDILECFHRKVAWLERVLADPAPVVWLHDAPPQAPGGRTPIPANSDELLASGAGVGRAFCLQARLNERAPQISASFGDLGAAQTFPLRLADFVLLKRGSHAWIGRPDAVKLMLGAAPDAERLGGAEMHCTVSGVGDGLFERDEEALDWIRACLGCLPSRAGEVPPVAGAKEPEGTPEEMAAAIPTDLNKPFEMKRVLRGIIDAGSWVEVQALYAREALTGFARVGGDPVGVLANNSSARGGGIFPETCRKMERFIRYCDQWGLPMVFLADNPGLMVGEDSERSGMLRAAADLVRALASCCAPRICFVARKAYTVGLYAMSGPGFEPARFWAAPGASISVFGPKALDRFAQDRDLPEAAREAIREMHHHAVEPRDYEDKGYLDGVIEWADIRGRLEEFLRETAAER